MGALLVRLSKVDRDVCFHIKIGNLFVKQAPRCPVILFAYANTSFHKHNTVIISIRKESLAEGDVPCNNAFLGNGLSDARRVK